MEEKNNIRDDTKDIKDKEPIDTKPKDKEVIVDIKNLHKVYRIGTERIVALENINLQIYKGEFCCLLGTSGSGKSTLLNAMAGIEKSSKGEIYIKGKPIHKMSEKQLAIFRQRNLGFVFQSYNLINSMTALENVTLPMIFKCMSKKTRVKKAKAMLAEVGLSDRLGHKPSQMSGGQQQRVGIARAFVASPDVVFADEPTGNLDSKTTKEILDLIKKISDEKSKTIIIVTHDPSLALHADRVIRIHDGNIISITERDNDGNMIEKEIISKQEEK